MTETMTTAQALKNQETRRERRFEAQRRINQIAYDAAEIARIHGDEPIFVCPKAYAALQKAMGILASIKEDE